MAITDPTGPSQRDLVFAGGGETGALMRAHDWATTPLGPVEEWPQSLRTAVSILLASGYPMLIVWGPEFVQIYNDAYAPVLGAKHPAALGQTSPECWFEIWQTMLEPMFQQVIDTGVEISAKDLMFPLERHGFIEECYFDFSYSPVRDESFTVSGILVTCSETTGRVLGERRLRMLRDMAEVSGGMVDAASACRAAAEILGRNTADVPFALIYLLDDNAEIASLCACSGIDETSPAAPATVDARSESAGSMWPIAEALASAAPLVVEDLPKRFGELPGGPWPEPSAQALILPIGHRGHEGPGGVLVAGLSPRLSLDADYQSFLTLVTDQIATAIGNARALEQEHRRAEALAELDRAKTTFFSNVSHEFRTPLSLLLGPLEDVLAREQALSPDEIRRQLEMSRRNGLRLLRLVNMLLDFSRIEAGRLQAVYEPTDLSACTRELASTFRSAIERAGLELIVRCEELPEPVFVDRDMWEKVVLNLLSNALKFTFEGQITVQVRASDNVAELSIEDTGIGIAEADLAAIFERFHRVTGARARTHEGSGIGLSLVQELVRLHGGTIQVQSALGKGTGFTVRVPFGTSHLPADRINAARVGESTSTASELYVEEALRWLAPPSLSKVAESHHVSSARVLIADDNADMREYLARLVGEVHHVEAVADGQAALDLALARPPDLIVTDVMMPGLDGFQLLTAVRSHPATQTVPVIVLSARAGEEARIEGLTAGADDYLVKPFTAREFMARINANLELARLRRETLHLEHAAREKSERERARFEAIAADNARLYVQAQRAHTELDQQRKSFLSAAAHDLRTPLAAVRAMTQLGQRRLRRSGSDALPQIERLLESIEASTSRMASMIDELLDISRIDTGSQLLLNRSETNLVELVQRVVAEQQETASGHTLQVVAGSEHVLGTWDANRLERVFANLIGNAIKFSPDGANVTVRVFADGQWANVAVQDHGLGIEVEDLERIFVRFERGANVKEIPGSGIGLAYVREIAVQHGGSIGVVSTPGQGSTFTLRLPLAPQ